MENLRTNFKEVVFKKIFYSLFKECKIVTITIQLAVIFYPVCIINTHILSLVPPLKPNLMTEINTVKSLSRGLLLYFGIL